MPVVGKYFPSQRSKEEIHLLLRRHWFTYAIFLFITVLMIVPLIIIAILWVTSPEYFQGAVINLLILGVSAYSLFILGLLLFGFIDYYLDVHIVTNQRIVDIKQNGFFKREIAELHLHQVQDVSAKVKGAFATLLHYGDIYIQTAGEKENFYFKAIPHPYRVSKLIVNLHESQIGQNKSGNETKNSTKNTSNPKIYLSEKNESRGEEEDFQEFGDMNKDAFSQARKNTKLLMKSYDQNEDENIEGDVISEEFDKKEKREILNGIGNNEQKAEQSGSKKPEGDKKNGEMHENEEIDI